MDRLDPSTRLVVLAIGLLVLLAPVLIIFLTVYFLSVTGELVLGQVTLLEFFELYLLDLALFVVFGYGLYRLTLLLAQQKLPVSLDVLELGDTDEDAPDPSENRE